MENIDPQERIKEEGQRVITEILTIVDNEIGQPYHDLYFRKEKIGFIEQWTPKVNSILFQAYEDCKRKTFWYKKEPRKK